jgi:hypothetical protein
MFSIIATIEGKTMEIDITDFVSEADPFAFSASAAELGANAGKITWNNAKQEAQSTQWISNDTRGEFESWVRDFGAWDAEEIAAWSLDDCNALLIQFISGDLRELESLCYSDSDEYSVDWTKAKRLSSEGTINGCIYKGDDNRVYFYMGG